MLPQPPVRMRVTGQLSLTHVYVYCIIIESRNAQETRIALLGNVNSFNPIRTKCMKHEVHCESICVA